MKNSEIELTYRKENGEIKEDKTSNTAEDEIVNEESNYYEQVKHQDTNHEYEYRWCCIRPTMCKFCYNWIYIFFILCVCIFAQNLITSGIGTAIVSTIEKEFYLTSTESGIFLGIYDLAAVFSSPVIGYFGGLKNANKMRIIAVNLIFVCIGSYVIGCTVFLRKPDESIYSNTNETTICRSNDSFNECEFANGDSNKAIASNLKYILYAANLVIGSGSVALYSVGVAFIEEAVVPSKSALCQAIFYGVGMYSIFNI